MAQLTKEQREIRFAAYLSMAVSLALLILKFWAYNMTRSQAVFSDAVESIVNVLTAFGAILVVMYSAMPADDDHPYGHGKVEYFSAAFEGGLIFFAALFIFVEAIKAVMEQRPIQQLNVGIGIVLGAGLANLFLGLYLLKRGRNQGSIALRASGQHVLSDFYTSVGVVLGLVAVKYTEVFWVDSLIAIVLGSLLAINGFRLFRDSIAGLMDKQDDQVLRDLAQVFSQYSGNGIIQLHNVKTIRSGNYHHIDAHIVLPEFWTVKEVHEKIATFEAAVIKSYPYSGEMNFHFDPCRQAYCRVCDLANCPIRKEAFVESRSVETKDLKSTVEPEEFRRKRRS